MIKEHSFIVAKSRWLDNGFKILYARIVVIKVHLPPKNHTLILFAVVAVLALAAVPSYYFYNKYQKSQELLKNPTEAARQEVQALAAQVGKYIELPKEEPTVATVSDKEKLNDQAFFAKAENGDKVLIYTQSRKAILFRPSTNKIIEVSTVNLGGAGSATSSAQVNNTVKLAIYNGTNTTGLTSKAEKQLKDKISNLDVVVKENAKKKDYEKTIVVVLSQNREQEAKTIAQVLGAQVSTLPEGEVKPKAEILIILGSDYTKR